MKHIITIVAIIGLCSILSPLQARLYTDSLWNYSIDIPEEWTVHKRIPLKDGRYSFFAKHENGASFTIEAFSKDFKMTMKDMEGSIRAKDSLFIDIEKPPFYNFLRRNIVCLAQKENGYYKYNYILRKETYFVITQMSVNDNFQESDEVLSSLNLHISLKEELRILRTNLGWKWTTLFFVLFPLLAWLSRAYRQYYKDWKRGFPQYVCCMIISVLLFAVTFVTLKDNLLFASIVVAVMFLLWLAFYFRLKYIMKFYNAVFK